LSAKTLMTTPLNSFVVAASSKASGGSFTTFSPKTT